MSYDDPLGCQVIVGAGGVPIFDEYPGPTPVAVGGGEPRPINPKRGKEYVIGGFTGGANAYRNLSDEDIAGLNRHLSRGMIRAMMKDPTVKPAFDTIKYATVSGDLKITPATHGKKKGENDQAEVELADEIAEFCSRALGRLDRHIVLVLAELFDSLAFRNKVGERVERLVTEGPDAGRWTLDRISIKPSWSYKFLVDSRNRLDWLRCMVEEDGKLVWRDIPRDRFVIAAWACEDGDPRGNTVMAPAYEPWVFKRRLTPGWWRGLNQFGTPSLFGTTAENAEDTYERDANGDIVTDENGDPLPAQNAQIGMRQSMEEFFQGGSIIVGPYGSNVKVIESTRDAAGVAAALQRCDQDITRVLMLQTHVTMEAKFGSKANSMVGQDVLGIFVQFLRVWLCAIVDRDILFPLVEINWGREIAERLTPNASLGRISAEDMVKFSNAIAALLQSGYFTEEQLAEMDVLLGLPVRVPGAERVGPQQAQAGNQNPGGQDPANPPPQESGGQANGQRAA